MTAPADLTVTEGSAGLRVLNLRKSYRKRPVIRDVSLELGRGEVVALLGPNGCGKTTCFYSIAGLVIPEGGHVMLDGRDVTTMPMYRRARLGIGYLPQEMSIFRGMTVEGNIMSILEIAEPDRTVRRTRLEELLSDFSIEHLRRTPALALSGGERRRTEIARCLAAGPKYVLLDEPFAGVDPIAVGEIRTPGRRAQDPRNRGADHRSQRPRDPRYRRSGLHPARWQGADERHHRRGHPRRECAPRLSGPELPRELGEASPDPVQPHRLIDKIGGSAAKWGG